MRIDRVILGGFAAASLLTGATSAFAASGSKPLAKMTCQDFLALDETVQPKAVYWAVAYAKGGRPEAAVLDVEGTDQLTPMLVQECKATPKESFWKKVKEHVKKMGAKMKKKM